MVSGGTGRLAPPRRHRRHRPPAPKHPGSRPTAGGRRRPPRGPLAGGALKSEPRASPIPKTAFRPRSSRSAGRSRTSAGSRRVPRREASRSGRPAPVSRAAAAIRGQAGAGLSLHPAISWGSSPHRSRGASLRGHCADALARPVRPGDRTAAMELAQLEEFVIRYRFGRHDPATDPGLRTGTACSLSVRGRRPARGSLRRETRHAHFCLLRPARLPSPAVEIRRQLGDQEGELLGDVHTHEVFCDHIGAPVCVGKDDIHDIPRTAQR